MKQCTQCRHALPAHEFGTAKRSPDGLASACLSCERDRNAAYYEANRGKFAERDRAYRLANPAAVKAHKAVQTARAQGRLRSPGACRICGPKALNEAHHDDYSKPLEVLYLCGPCHRLGHRRSSGGKLIRSVVIRRRADTVLTNGLKT